MIDTHLHLWDPKRLCLPWLKEYPSLHRPYTVADYFQAVTSQPVVKAIYLEVDVLPEFRQLEIEDRVVQDHSPDSLVQGMVIGIDPGSDSFLPYLDHNASHRRIKGVRRVLQTQKTPPGYCLSKTFMQNIKELGSRGLTFDLCMRPAELLDGLKLIQSCPQTKFILDHCGNPDPYVVQGARDHSRECPHEAFRHTRQGWLDAMQRIAQQPNVFCKISGIIERVSPGWDLDVLAPTIEICLDLFGEDRVLFGGNWPVCTLTASFAEWIEALRTITKKRSETLQHKLFCGNAKSLFQL